MLIFINGCSALRRKSNSNYPLEKELSGDSLIKEIEKQNLTNGSFFIQKAEIEISAVKESQKLLASIKYEFPAKYLISIRNRTGIEAARIFMNSDTVFINDRINRKLYHGYSEKVKTKFGISAKVLPVILGDLIYKKKINQEKIICKNGKAGLDYSINGLKIRYNIDCAKKKIIEAEQESDLINGNVAIEFENFKNYQNGFVPTKVGIKFRQLKVSIKIIRIESPWNGSIEFIPGNKYDIIEL